MKIEDTTKRRGRIRRWVSAAIFAVLSGTTAQTALADGGTLTVASPFEPATLVPISDIGLSTQRIGPKVTEGLLDYDGDLNPQPQLAKEWTVSDDGLTYTFTLQDGVRWHDGEPFTSDDVAFSVMLLKETHPRARTTFANVTEVETPDPQTAVLKLSKPAPYLLSALYATEAPMLPKHIYEGTNAPTNPQNAKPIGTGPFKFEEWERGSHVILVRNDDYWDEGKPYLDRVIYRFIPDAAARAAALEAGEILLAGDTPVPLTDLERLKAMDTLEVKTDGYSYNGNHSELVFNLDNEILAEQAVRRALAHLIDIDALVNVAWFGYAEPSPTPIGPTLAAYTNTDVEPYPFDVAEAERLLDEAGFPRQGDGTRFTLKLNYNPSFDSVRRMAELIKQWFQKAGVKVEIEALDFPSYVRAIYADRDFDMTVETLSNSFDPTIGVQRVFHTKAFKPGLPFSNPSHYSNPEVDALFEKAAVEADEAARVEQFRRIQEIVHEELPVVDLVNFDGVTVSNVKVQDHTYNAASMASNFARVKLAE
ncbi:ABC transporter substrate-binding protein [Amorphus sp. 3PC139-8]|uniref:ABC transporter substrate-binding protein n=1 Tax=Amorphus sp. 3PC139-8 TaxID=2735676 RepID=UPI00345CD8CD